MKNNDKDLFDSILILRYSETKVAKEELYSAKKLWNVNVNNIVILELVEIKTNSKYLIEYLDKVI